MNAIDRRTEIHRPRSKRVARTARHEAGQIGLARDHLWRRRPVRPFGLARDVEKTLPLESFAPDTNTVADCAAARLDKVEMTLGAGYDDGAWRLRGAVVHDLFAPLRDRADNCHRPQVRVHRPDRAAAQKFARPKAIGRSRPA